MTDHAAWSARLLALTEAPEIDWPAVMAHLPSRSESAAMKSAHLHCYLTSQDGAAWLRSFDWLLTHSPDSIAREAVIASVGTPRMARHGG